MEEKKNNGVTVSPEPVSVVASVLHPTVWISENFAQDWFADAKNEAKTGKDYNSRRREILFATCFLESYVFEWTRQIVQIENINDYFPPTHRSSEGLRYRRSLKKKWKEVPKELYDDGKISANPQLDLSKLGTLLRYRHGLVHAAASRPATDAQPKETKPFPPKKALKQLKPGWALAIAIDLVQQLHKALNSAPPEYCSLD
jgi:hypothetical protein